MPLRDHFHGALDDESWPSLHGAWAGCLQQDLFDNHLSRRYRVEILTRLGQFVEVDVASLDSRPHEPSALGNGVATATWAPPGATLTLDVPALASDTFEVMVFRGRRLVAAVELVSPANKARPDARQAFAEKCASFLRSRVSVVIVDIVTDRHADLYAEVLTHLGMGRRREWLGTPPVYTVAMKATKIAEEWKLQTWEQPLALGQPLPTMPLWVADDLVVPLELEPTYNEACRRHDIT